MGPELSPDVAPRARKNQSTILHALSSAGQKPVAEALRVSEATVSRMKGEAIESFSALLAVLGLKVVPQDHRCYSPAKYEALRTLAMEALEREDSPALEWDDGVA